MIDICSSSWANNGLNGLTAPITASNVALRARFTLAHVEQVIGTTTPFAAPSYLTMTPNKGQDQGRGAPTARRCLRD